MIQGRWGYLLTGSHLKVTEDESVRLCCMCVLKAFDADATFSVQRFGARGKRFLLFDLMMMMMMMKMMMKMMMMMMMMMELSAPTPFWHSSPEFALFFVPSRTLSERSTLVAL